MGKKRITILGEETTKKKADSPRRKRVGSDEGATTAKATAGQKHGRIADMGTAALEEAEVIAQKESAVAKALADKEGKVETTTKSQKHPKPSKKIHSQRFLAARKKIDRTKFYPLTEAISLVKKTAISRFKGGVELHLVLKETGLKKEVTLPYPLAKDKAKITVATEKKAPLVHLVIGKLEMADEQLTANFQAVTRAFGTKNIKKAVLCSTMGPGVKVEI